MKESPKITIGSETEYGIAVEADGKVWTGRNAPHVIFKVVDQILDEGAFLVGGGVSTLRDTYASVREHNEAERQVRDHKGDSAVRVLADEREATLFSQRRGYTGSLLANGARFYNDMLHPEYSCPECADPMSALMAQKAGDAIVCEAAFRATACAERVFGSPAAITILKNNSDGLGNSYAGHENYAVSRTLFELLGEPTPESATTVLFFIARQIIVGAGKIGGENGPPAPFQISQRADFFSRISGTNTTRNRGILNMRDVSYARNDQCRFHVIVGDSNRSELSLFLKFGMTALYFMMLDSGFIRDHFPWYGAMPLRPIQALKGVSRDLSLCLPLRLCDERRATALQVLSDLAECADAFVSEYALGGVWRRVVEMWRGVLEGLKGDRHTHPLARSLDWVVVERLLCQKVQKKGGDFMSDECVTLECAYRMLGDDSVYALVERAGILVRLAADEDIRRLVHSPPRDTRAWLRSEVIKRYERDILYMCWNHVVFQGDIEMEFSDPLWGGEDVAAPLFAGDPSLKEFIERARGAVPGQILVQTINRRRDDRRRPR